MRRLLRLTLLLVLLVACRQASAAGVTPYGDVLVWHASEETSSIWSSTIAESGTTHSFSAANVDFDWDPGFRIGLAHQRDAESWDTRLYWAYFHTSADMSQAPGLDVIIPEFFSGFISGSDLLFDSAALNWGLSYNTLDFELGRTIRLGEALSIRPSMGLKAALIDQKITARWASLLGPAATERVDHDFQGIGPAFGIAGRWNSPRLPNWSVVGSFSAALLWGEWNIEDTFERTDPGLPLSAYGAFTTSMNDSSLGTLNLNYFLGLQWVRPGDVTITGRLGYELQWWANQQRLPTFQQLPMHGDLTLEGLSCGVSLEF